MRRAQQILARSRFRTALFACVFCTLCGTRRIAGQGGNVPDEAKALIVKVVTYYQEGSAPEVGAGIIVGATATDLYVATARHVVRRDTVAQRIWVVLPSRDSAEAALVARARSRLDLAVLRVSVDSARWRRWTAYSWDRRGEPGSLRGNDPVSPVGCPQDSCWQAPAPADRVIGVDRLGILFQSSFVGPGSSGGALFNAWWEVVGMVTEDAPPRANAIRIDEVLAQVQAWRIPVTLKRPSLPRAGYRTTIGLLLLTPTSSTGAGTTRSGVPGGRLTIVHQVMSAVSWHVAALRLTPQNCVRPVLESGRWGRPGHWRRNERRDGRIATDDR